ncbi:hypothetical protein BDR04DRAFT_1146199 [Suillus decipiens]|nr:hypothetical protein BDR04DRAFT_1146199 [Suillus decipiens]
MHGLLNEMARLIEALHTEAGMAARFSTALISHNVMNYFVRDKVDKVFLTVHKVTTLLRFGVESVNYQKLVDDVVKYMAPLPGWASLSDSCLRVLLAFDNPTLYLTALIAQSTLTVEIPDFVLHLGHPKDRPEVMYDDEKKIKEKKKRKRCHAER